jgi:transcriptional regulator with XRE-family HTH domain
MEHEATSLLSRWERGKEYPNLLNALKLASILEYSVETLFTPLYEKLKHEVFERWKKLGYELVIKSTPPADCENQIARYRKRLGLTQLQVAKLMGMKTYGYISKLENGKKLPTLTNALKLGLVLKCPVEILFSKLNKKIRQEVEEKKGDSIVFNRVNREN